MMFFKVKRKTFLAQSQVVFPSTREFPRKIIDKERLADLLTDGETSESGPRSPRAGRDGGETHGNEATRSGIDKGQSLT